MKQTALLTALVMSVSAATAFAPGASAEYPVWVTVRVEPFEEPPEAEAVVFVNMTGCRVEVKPEYPYVAFDGC